MKKKPVKKLKDPAFIADGKNSEYLNFLTTHKPFIELVKEARKEFNIPQFGFSVEKETEAWYMDIYTKEEEYNKLNKISKDIIKKFKLPSHFEHSIMPYIVSNKFWLVPATGYNFKIEKDSLSLFIHSKLSKEEINKLIKFIRIFNKKLPYIPKISQKTKEQLEVETSLSTENFYNESDNKITTGEIAKEYFGKKGKPQQVYDSKRLLKKKRGKRFG